MDTQAMEKKEKILIPLAKVAVVILNWNGKKWLEKFIPSVVQSTYENLEVIVADNASSDDSLSWLKNNYKDSIRVIELKENYGFAEGYNQALKHVEADYFILLNSDVEVSENWIEEIVQIMDADPSIGAAQPKILSYNNKSNFEYAGASGGFIDAFGYPFCRGRILDVIEKDNQQYENLEEVFWASGAALFIRSSVWKEMNGLDGDYFAHMEEIDLCWRLRQSNYKIICVPSSVVYHVGGGTLNSDSPQKTYLNFRNSLFTLQKNLPFGSAFFIIFIRFWMDLLALLFFMFQGKFKHASSVSRAHRHFFRDFFKTVKKRQVLPPKRRVGPYYNGWIIWAFYLKKIRVFSALNRNNFQNP